MSPDSVLHMLQRVLKRAGLPRIRFHDLRHTFATMALQNGVDVKNGQQYARTLLGRLHAGHLRPRHHRRTAQSGANDGEHPLPCGIDAFRLPAPVGVSVWVRKKQWQKTATYAKQKDPKPYGFEVFLARREGFEPPAFWSVARRSIQLS